MIKNTDVPTMKKAVRVIYDMSEDTRIKEIARLREKALHDEASALGNARREGLAEGMEKGLAQGMERGLAQGMERGMEKVIEQMRRSGLTKEQIKQILDS